MFNKQSQYTYQPISQEVKAMNFGQIVECNMRNSFLEKSYTKCGGETIPRAFLKNKKIPGSIV